MAAKKYRSIGNLDACPLFSGLASNASALNRQVNFLSLTGRSYRFSRCIWFKLPIMPARIGTEGRRLRLTIVRGDLAFPKRR